MLGYSLKDDANLDMQDDSDGEIKHSKTLKTITNFQQVGAHGLHQVDESNVELTKDMLMRDTTIDDASNSIFKHNEEAYGSIISFQVAPLTLASNERSNMNTTSSKRSNDYKYLMINNKDDSEVIKTKDIKNITTDELLRTHSNDDVVKLRFSKLTKQIYSEPNHGLIEESKNKFSEHDIDAFITNGNPQHDTELLDLYNHLSHRTQLRNSDVQYSLLKNKNA